MSRSDVFCAFPSAKNREAGEEVLSINIHEVNILLSNLTLIDVVY